MAEWPFTVGELTAGLRRYFAAPALNAAALEEFALPPTGRVRPAGPGVRGLHVVYEISGANFEVDCVVKQPPAAARAGLAHPGVREAGVYRSLAVQLPMATPALVAADPSGSWLVLEAVEAPHLGPWTADEYGQAVGLLARLHERFWGLDEDLATYPWLARPLTLDYEIHVHAAAQALENLVHTDWPPLIVQSPEALTVLGQMVAQADRVLQPLLDMPLTLLHGDYWEGNLLRDEDGDLVVFDWQSAAIGPGVLDLVVMATTGAWERATLPLPPEAMAERYRAEVAARLGVHWSDTAWSTFWDHALLWRFLQETLSWVAGAPRRAFAPRAAEFERVWLKPVLAAAGRRLAPLYAFDQTLLGL